MNKNKTIRIKNIDGYDIIAGFGTLTIDPVATKKIVEPLLEGTDEAAEVSKKNAEMRRISKAYSDSLRAAKEAYKINDASNHAKHMYNAELRSDQLRILQGELIELIKLAGDKKRQLWSENLVYFEPNSGEILLDDAELSEKYVNLKDKELLTITGEVVADKRGVKFVKAGKVETVGALGVDPDGPLMEDVTPEQFEVMRLEAMTNTEKTTELESIVEGLAGQAANMRAVLEIKGDVDALTKAQDWYNAEVVKANGKYK